MLELQIKCNIRYNNVCKFYSQTYFFLLKCTHPFPPSPAFKTTFFQSINCLSCCYRSRSTKRRNDKKYCKIPKLSPRAYIFQRPFLRGLSIEGNLRFKIDWTSLLVGRKFTVFALFHFVFEGNFQVQAPGQLIFGGTV